MIAQAPQLAHLLFACGLIVGMVRDRSVAAIVKSALLAAFIFLIVIPPLPVPYGVGLDASWVFGLNMAHLDRFIFGRDVIFPYGPLGYLMVPTFPEAEPWAVFAYTWGIAVVTGYSLWRLSQQAGHWTTRCLYLGVFAAVNLFLFDSSIERPLIAIIALALAIAVRWDAEPWLDLGILFFCSGAALLAKFNTGIVGSLLALYFQACFLWRRRSTLRLALKPAAAALMVWPCTIVGLYWILDGTAWGLGAFLRNSSEMVRGYSEAMSVAGPLWVAAAALLCCLTLWIGVPLLSDQRRRVLWGLPPLMVIGFLGFKSALVRQDAHALPFPFEISMAALMVVALAPTRRNRALVGAFRSCIPRIRDRGDQRAMA